MENQKIDSAQQLKKNQRDFLKTVRSNLSFIRRKQASEEACKHLYDLLKNSTLILSFASAGNEINLWPLNRKLADEGRLVLPRLEQNRLQLFRVVHCKHLERHAWGILEPISSVCAPCNFSCADSILIPGLGFDIKTKFRLGYGLGCYDRMLSVMPNAETFGVGFKEQIIQFPFQEAHDVPMKHVVLF
ncbi:MAG: 5-formyltetrahydrofolate cyclo-ligase [Parachlamydiaceae bacterium]|nr:5-formyltetrahydrofolate cyclo-ligase [Parachlamydiaceae bacterium]